jgi:hypothetical protein
MAGTATCLEDGGGWGACEGQVLPATDDCTTQADEDCDGVVQACPTGTPLWAKRFGESDSQDALAVAVDAGGNGIIGGTFVGSMSFGGPTMTAVGIDAYLVKLDAAGNHVWTKHYSGQGTREIRRVAVAPNGDIFVAGAFREQIDLGGGPVTTSQNEPNVFVARLDGSGNHIWTRAAGDPNEHDLLEGMAVDTAGNVVVCGDYQGVLDFGGAPLISTNDRSVFVVKLDASGNTLWAKSLGGPYNERCMSAAADATDHIVITGGFVGPADIGGGLISGGGLGDAYVTRFDPAGNTVFALPFGDSAEQGGTDVVVDASGNIFAAGKFYGSIDFGGGPLQNGTIYLAKLDPTGNHLFSKAYAPDGNLSGAVRLALDHFGNLAACGEFFGDFDLGGGTLPWTGQSNDMFFAKLDATLGHWWSRSAGASGFVSEDCRNVAADGSGNVWAVGRFESPVDFGTGVLSPVGSLDVFVAKYEH